MNSQLPYFLQVLQALSTPAVALLAIVIAVVQWRTAHQRAVLDLFDKRLAIFTRMREIIGMIVREGSVSTEIVLKFVRA